MENLSEAIEIPTTLDELTAVWLTEALRNGGVIEGETAVSSFTTEPVGEAGYAGQVARIQFTYDSTPAANAPASLIAKFSNPDPNVREILHDMYEREVRIYQELMSEMTLNAPRCYFSAIVDPENGHCVLLLEDLTHLRQGDIALGCSLEDAETVVTHFARHHAQWWDNQQLATFDFLLQISTTPEDEDFGTYQSWWSQFEDKATTLLPDCYLPASFLEMGQRHAFQIPKFIRQTLECPFTFIHRDPHLDNLMFAANENDLPLTVLDWQLGGYGVGVSDIAYFIILSLSVKLRRQAEHGLLQTYHATLVENGVSNYSFEQCWRDYRRSFFRAFGTIVAVVAFIDLSGEHGRGFVGAALPRLASFAEDHQVSEFLD